MDSSRSRHGRPRAALAGLLIALLLAQALWAPPAQAASFTVNSPADLADANPGDGTCRTSAGSCTLRAAIQEANARAGADTVSLPAGTYTLDIEPLNDNADDTGDLDITGPLTLTGSGAATTIVDGGQPPEGALPEIRGLDRIFEIHPTAGNVTIGGLTMRDGTPFSSAEGGALWNGSAGTVRLQSVGVIDSFATSYGGGIYSEGEGRLELSNSTISGNATVGEGGGVYIEIGVLAISGGTLANNSARGGGGVYNAGVISPAGLRARVELSGTTVTGNFSTSGGGGILNGLEGELILTNATVTANSSDGDGGGVASVSKSSLTISGGTYSDNTTAGSGGAVYSAIERPVSVSGANFFNNSAAEEGGALLADGTSTVAISGSDFASNYAHAGGGAILVGAFGTVEISSSTLRNNRTLGSGGGLLNSANRVTLTRVTVSGNSAGADGGGIHSEASGDFQIIESSLLNNSAANGGGLSNDADSTLKVYRTTIWANRALAGAGDDASGYGGGVFNQGDAAAEYENVTISGNYAQTVGGGLFIDADAGVRVVNTTISRNAAPVAAGVGEELGAPPAPGDPPPTPSTAVIFRNTIVADNTGAEQCNYAIGSEGGNLNSDSSCYFIGTRDRSNVGAGLDAIADNGGPTLTHEPTAASIAVDNGVTPCPAVDQRGISRPRNVRCDSGAVEFTGTPATPDGTAPQTVITDAPARVGEIATFSFTGSDNVSAPEQLAFECRLLTIDPTEVPDIPDPTQPPDPEFVFLPCASPYEILGVQEGENTFEVRAIDRAGNVDPTPAQHTFTAGVDVNPPDTIITSGPANPSSTRGATFTFSATDDVTPPALIEYECRLDSLSPEGWLECFSPAVFTNLTSGQHTLEVRATDEFGNVDPTPASYTWTVGPPANCDVANVTLSAVADTYVDENFPTQNFGTSLSLAVRSQAPGDDARTLLRFVLPSDLPACDLRSATLRLYSDGEPGRTLQALAVAAAWGESQVTWQTQPATTGSALTATSGAGYREWNVAAHVSAMLAGFPNHGWLIRDATEEAATGAEQSFAARDTISDVPVTPQLVLRFDGPGDPIPSPPAPPTDRSVKCGQVITKSTRITNSLNNCPGEGLVIGAPNIILDLNGKTIDGVALFGTGQEEGIPAGIRNSGHTNVIIRNGTVKEFGAGVQLTAGTTYNVIHNLTLTRNVLAGVELIDADNGRNGNEIRNNSFVDNEYGVTVINGSENSVVRNNSFQGNVGSAIYIFDSSGQRVEANTISGIPVDPLLGSDFGILLEGAPDTAIIGNTVSDTGDAGIVVGAGSHRTLVQGNSLSRVGDAGVAVSESDSVDVLSNVAHLTSDAGVNVDASAEVVVRANDVRFNPAGVELGDATDGLVELNDASYSGAGIGLSGGSLRNLVVDNIASATGGDGIGVEVEAIDTASGDNLGGNLLARNRAHGNASDGISLLGGGHTLADNDTDNNAGFGIRADADTIDGGGNTARGNAEPGQCTGIVCEPGVAAPAIVPDLTEPNTTISAGPANPSNAGTVAVLTFSGSDNLAPATALRFECRLDVPNGGSAEGWVECVSPQRFSGLQPGEHRVEVRAIDPFDNADSTPASYTWTVLDNASGGPDTVAPNTFIVERPDDPTTSTSATFRFRGSDDVTAGPSLRYQCKLDNGSFSSCTSPKSYTNLAPGVHTFQVRALDQANNSDATPDSYTWTILPASPDTNAPETTIVSGPDATTVSTSASFSFASDEAPVTYECSVDGGAVIDCANPYTFTNLEIGPHALAVVAIDAAGNRDLSPALYYWEVTAPPVPIAASCGLVITRSVTLTGDLTGCAGDGLVIGASAITLDLGGFSVSGTNLGVGIRNDGFDSVTITDGTISGFDYGVQIGAGSLSAIVAGLTIRNNQDGGLLLSGAGSADEGPVVRDSTIGANASGLIIEAGTVGALVQRSVIGGSAGEGVTISGSGGNRIEDSTISGSGGTGVLLDGASGNTLLRNRIEANRGGGVELLNGSNANRVERNTLAENASGLVLADSSGNSLIGNSAQRITGAGVELTNANDNLIGANDLRFNTAGVELFASSGNRIESNNTSEASGPGISLGGGSFRNVVLGNIASNGDAEGIEVGDLAEAGQGNLIERNTTSGNAGGISVSQGGHTITANTANNNNGWGIYAAEGNTDGGGNSAVGNGEPAQCFNVVCDGSTPIPPGPPETELVLRPANPSLNGYAVFTFTGFDDTTPPDALGFECRLDSTLDTAWVECENPWEYFNLANGPHTFEVRAVDELANVDPTPASFAWTVQLPAPGTPPDTAITFAPAPITPVLDATFAFSSTEPNSTFQCSLDNAPFTACTSPAEYTDLALGQHIFRVRATDPQGDVDPTPAGFTWTIVGPPTALITAGPADPTTETSATFSFTADVPGSTFACSLDGADFAPCASPISYSGLIPGEHIFLVAATAPDGQQSLEATEYGWSIDAVVDTFPPDTVFTLTPAASSGEATFAFSGSDNETPATALTFECRLDSALETDFADCLSPTSLPGLTAGAHTFDVRAIDREGNIDPTPASFTWTYVLDTLAPQTALASTPDAVTTSATARFSFAANEPTLSFECSLDGVVFTECASPAVYTGLEPGAYTFSVRAIDLAGNVDASPASYSWVVNAPPETTIELAPDPVTVETSATFVFSATEELVTYECALDNGAFAPCTSPRTYTNLAVGEHEFFVRARDSYGLPDPSPASYLWFVGRPPETGINGGPALTTELTTATFAFSSPEPGATFECALDGGPFVACASPESYSGFSVGAHVFEVRAVAPNGLVDPTPADYEWEVIAPIPPETTIASGPAATTVSTSASFSFSSNEAGASFECALDTPTFTPCTSPRAYSGLAIGSHTFQVRAIDAAGNPDPSPASFVWSIQAPDTTPPDTTITASPPAATTSTTATFAFASTEAGSTFQCSLNGGAFGECTSPASYTALAVGARSFTVRALDPAGNVDPTPATFSWTIQQAATCTVSTVTYQANADAWLEQNGPTSNKGTDSINKIKSQGPTDNFRTVVRFNLPTSIPAGCQIASATLRMFSPSAVSGRTLQAFQLGGAWTENAITWGNQPATTGPAATVASGTGNRDWLVTSQVRGIFAAGANHGFLIRDAAESGSGFEQSFHSRESGSNRPVLIVQYTQAP